MLSTTHTDTGFAGSGAVLGPCVITILEFGLDRCGGVNKGNGGQTVDTIVTGHGSGNLQETLSTHEVGLEVRAKRITAPGDTGSMETGTTE